jgi:hypothetical protein
VGRERARRARPRARRVAARLDISGFTALSERLQEKGKLGAEELVLLISGLPDDGLSASS